FIPSRRHKHCLNTPVARTKMYRPWNAVCLIESKHRHGTSQVRHEVESVARLVRGAIGHGPSRPSGKPLSHSHSWDTFAYSQRDLSCPVARGNFRNAARELFSGDLQTDR